MRHKKAVAEFAMKLSLLALAPIALCASVAWSDDGMDRVTPTDGQLLKQCMEQQKTSSNVTVSKAEAKRFCKDQLKRQKQTGASSERQPVDTPHDSPAEPSDAPRPAPETSPTQPPPG
jgi:hypothetical protein